MVNRQSRKQFLKVGMSSVAVFIVYHILCSELGNRLGANAEQFFPQLWIVISLGLYISFHSRENLKYILRNRT